jgi:HlyD family secretion protein
MREKRRSEDGLRVLSVLRIRGEKHRQSYHKLGVILHLADDIISLMRFLPSRPLTIFIAVLLIGAAIFLINRIINPETPNWTTAVVEKGNVSELVSVSGFVEAKRVAELAFPSSGVVTDILVEEGSRVEAGEIIATLAATTLVAERNEAVSALTSAQAAFSQTSSGPRFETIDLANTSLANAQSNLERVTLEENRKVNNARAALLSTGLTATTADPEEENIPPTVSGTYTCEDEGIYKATIYNSNSKSGYSYTFTGLEQGTEVVSFEQPVPLGSCGLYLKFAEGTSYSRSEWSIEVPNTRSSGYVTLANSLKLAETQADNAILGAKNALTLAQKESTLSTAPARSEELTQASAAVSQARARVAAIDARISDRSIVAPFSGIITKVNITKGEVAPVSAVINLLADDTFTLKARIPEIDITKMAVGQKVKAVFDAQSSETLNGKLTYVSPIAELIDGVAYFETIIELETSPEWLRAGLNADIDIIVASRTDVLRIPRRFVSTLENGQSVVLVPQGNKTATTTVEILFTGNDSFLEISGISEGTIVIAP